MMPTPWMFQPRRLLFHQQARLSWTFPTWMHRFSHLHADLTTMSRPPLLRVMKRVLRLMHNALKSKNAFVHWSVSAKTRNMLRKSFGKVRNSSPCGADRHSHLYVDVASERDADAKLRASVQNLMAQREALVQRTAGIRKEVSEIRAQMEARKQHKQVQVQRLREQVRRNAPELAQLERLTGCTISPSVRAGTIDFAFSLISRDNPARSAILSLDVSKTQYKVPMYDSILSAATVKALLQELERTGDVYTFLKRARSAMVDSLAREN